MRHSRAFLCKHVKFYDSVFNFVLLHVAFGDIYSFFSLNFRRTNPFGESGGSTKSETEGRTDCNVHPRVISSKI